MQVVQILPEVPHIVTKRYHKSWMEKNVQLTKKSYYFDGFGVAYIKNRYGYLSEMDYTWLV